MIYQKLFKGWCFISALLLSLSTFADAPKAALSGFWQHEDQPVVVEMKRVDGLLQGTVTSNADKPESVGKRLFRDLSYDGEQETWEGRIYVLKLEEEKDVSIILKSPEQFMMTVKVGFFTKKVHWNKLEPATNTTQ